jgi:superfamily I DNA/RNA helicase
MTADLENKLDRLTRLMGTDEGFYILALHAFVEYFLRYEKRYGEGPTFPELTWIFREELLQDHGEGFVDGLYCLGRLGKQHLLTNRVRHAFERMDPEEAAAATHLFATFCKLAGIGAFQQVHLLEKSLAIWSARSSVLESAAVIRGMQEEIRRLQDRARGLLEQRREYESLKEKLEQAQRRLADSDRDIRQARETEQHRKERLDALRWERNALIRERDELLVRMEGYQELERYLRYLGRLSIYTRTRMDYEQSISQLTPEQEQIVSSLNPARSILIRGGAGTGKSLVLIECLRRYLSQKQLPLGDQASVVLVTFTNALARYSRYIAEIKAMRLPPEIISTVDGLFFRKLQRICPEAKYDFELLEAWVTAERTPAFFTPEELASELENFLFAEGITEKEYLEEIVPRTGLRRRLSAQQRQGVWRIRQQMAAEMEERKTYTKNYGRLKVLEYLQSHPEDRGIRDIGVLFLDEVQDLNPVALRALRELTRGAMIMAGDGEQSIYSCRSPFRRSGISLRGATRILKTNFRNTIQVYELADRFRRRSLAAAAPEPSPAADVGAEAAEEPADAARPFPFREGPPPELYTARSVEELQRLLLEKIRLFLEELGYDAENLCILVPRKCEIEPLRRVLEKAGLELEAIREEQFSFRSTGKVRVSTLHSSKGLDFPVVLLYLPYLSWRKAYDDAQTERLLRNLLYVGITRAMDNVNAFILEGGDPILRDLAVCFGA